MLPFLLLDDNFLVVFELIYTFQLSNNFDNYLVACAFSLQADIHNAVEVAVVGSKQSWVLRPARPQSHHEFQQWKIQPLPPV